MAKRSKRKKARSNEIPAKVRATWAVAQGPSFRLSRDWVWGVILVLAVILTYQPVWHAGFVWDDELLITANPVIIGPLGLKEIWTTNAAGICPLTLTTFWVEHALWGLHPLPYHLVNVLLHGVCAILLWRVLRSLRVPGAWLGAALWALHPVEVESAAWIAEMKNTQSELRLNPALRRTGDGEQVIHGDSAGGALLVRLVGGGPVALAQPDENSSNFSNVRWCLRLVDVDARAAIGNIRHFPMGANLAGALGDSG
jgi:hypothetical protein